MDIKEDSVKTQRKFTLAGLLFLVVGIYPSLAYAWGIDHMVCQEYTQSGFVGAHAGYGGGGASCGDADDVCDYVCQECWGANGTPTYCNENGPSVEVNCACTG
jgi:hypothetical protein